MERGNGNSFFKRHKFSIASFFAVCLAFAAQAGTAHAKLPSQFLTEFAENNILYYDPCDGVEGLGNGFSNAPGSCAKIGELRTKMWNAASEKDKEDFMFIISNENDSLAGVEAYMNQVVARSDGDLHKWLNGLCLAFRNKDPSHPRYLCSGSHKTTEKEQKWIDKALAGSNITNFATGNSSWSTTGGDATTGGRLTCFWISDENSENGGACKDDVDYSKEPFKSGTPKKGVSGYCSDMIKAAGGDINSGWECWAWDNTGKWSKSMAAQCNGYSSVGAANEDEEAGEDSSSDSSDSDSNSGSSSSSVSSSVSWDKDGWITGGFDGYTKEPSDPLINSKSKYKSGKPDKIALHYTQGTTDGLAAYGDHKDYAAHFTIDLLKKQVAQHVPIGKPSGALKEIDNLDVVQIEIVGYGFQKDNPDNPDEKSKCVIDGTDYTKSDYCFAKFGDEEWDYLANLLRAISKWASDNQGNIPLTSSVKWTGDVNKVRLSEKEWNKTSGIVAHMHAPHNDHNDTGNIWPYVSDALSRNGCVLTGDTDSIKGAKNAEKQSNEVGDLTWTDSSTSKMKTMLENYGDLAYRSGQAYGIPWVAILVQARYEDSKAVCGKNNFWGIKCYPGSKKGEGANVKNLGEGFTLYGKTVHNGNYKEALKATDPKEYLEKIGPMWVQGDKNGKGYGSIKDMKKSVDALVKYIESDEGKQVVAAFGAANCNDKGTNGFCEGGSNNQSPSNSDDILANIKTIIDLANKNGSTYSNTEIRSIEGYKKVVNNGAALNTDCTGFASMVYWMTYGDAFTNNDVFWSGGIVAGDFPSYKEVKRSEVRPGDIFAWPKQPGEKFGHGGIVVEVENGTVTKIAQVGGKEGRSGNNNNNIGYTSNLGSSHRVNSNITHFFRWKGAN